MTTTSSVSSHSPASALPPRPASVPQPASFATALRAMLRKDPRELAIVAGLVTAAYSLILAFQLYSTHRQFSNEYSVPEHSNTALSEAFLASTLLLGPLAALLIGFVHFIGESRPDRFGLLTHRPASRSTLFACKSIIGAGLYLLAMLVPLLVALFWASNPSNLPLPFTWKMATAPFADVLSGIPYYFAGALVAQRIDARWLGSRLLPIAGPILVSLGLIASPTFIWTLPWIVLGILAMATPARAYFLAAGQYPRVALHARPFLGFALLSGLVTIGALCLALIDQLTPPRSRYYSPATQINFLKEDGRPVQAIPNDRGEMQIVDLGGNVIPGNPSRTSLTLNGFSPAYLPDSVHTQFHESFGYFDHVGIGDGRVRWYRAGPSAGNDYLVGFDEGSRTLIGAIGAAGLEPGVARPRARFAQPMLVLGGNFGRTAVLPGPYWPDHPLVSSADILYRFSDTLVPERIYATPNHQPIIGLGRVLIFDEGMTHATSYYNFLKTAGELIMLDSQDKPVLRYEVPHLSRFDITVYSITPKQQFLVELRPHDQQDKSLSRTAAYFNADGTLDHKIDLPLNTQTYARGPNAIEDIVGPAAAPPAAIGVAVLLALLFDDGPHHWNDLIPIITWSLGTAAIMAILTFLITMRKKMGLASFLWTAVALLFGPAGLVLLFAMRGLPLTIPCTSCGKRLHVTQSNCPACGTPVTGPPANGTEIFAPQ